MIEGGVLTEREHGVLEIDADDGRRLLGELLAGRVGRDGRGEDETLEGTEADAVSEANEVEVAEDVGVAAIERISEAVGEEGVACEPLGLLDEQAERERRRGVERGRRAGRQQPCLRVHDQSSDEVQVRLGPMLLRQLLEHTRTRGGQTTLSASSATRLFVVGNSEHSPNGSLPGFCRNCPL